MKALWLLIFPAYFNCSVITAQDTLPAPGYGNPKFDKHYFKSILHDGKDLVLEPSRWKGKSWLTGAALGGVTAISFWQDDHIREIFNRNRNESMDNVVKYGTDPFGNIYSFTFLISSYVYGAIAKDYRSKKTAMVTVKALLFSTLITRAAKFASNRERPYQDEPAGHSDEYSDPLDTKHGRNDSFFSGHTVTAFTVAAVYTHEYKEKKWVPYVAYTLAASAGLSRLYLDKHWASDVVVGAITGYYVGHVIHKHNNWKVKVIPIGSRNVQGLRFSYEIGK